MVAKLPLFFLWRMMLGGESCFGAMLMPIVGPSALVGSRSFSGPVPSYLSEQNRSGVGALLT